MPKWTLAQTIAYAKSQIGETDGGKYFKIAFGYRSLADWCAAWCSAVKVQGELDCPYFPNGFAFDKRDLNVIGDRWVEPRDLQPGDFIGFDLDGGGQYGGDHVGLVIERVAAGDYWTVEGNCGAQVKLKHRTIANCRTYNNDGSLKGIGIIGGIRPKYKVNIFTDVDDSTPHSSDIEWLKKRGITTGYADGSFKPNAKLVRGDCAAFLHRLDGSAIFKDVTAKTAHFEDIAWMAAKGISTGFADGTFRPSSNVTRADMAAFLYRLAGEPEFTDTSDFIDVSGIAHEKAIRWLGTVGISTGYSDKTFRPYSNITRADAAAMLHRAAGK